MLDEESIQKLTRDKCIEKIEGDWSTWFRNFRGNENETWEIQFVPKALSKTKAQSTTKYKFQSSLDPNEVPNISAKWCPDESFILQLMTTFLMYTATLKVHSQVRDNFWQLKAL